MYDIKSMQEAEITELLKSMGEPAFRGRQLFKWLIGGESRFDKMLNLPAPLRQRLSETCGLYNPEALRRQVSRDGTIKLLWRLEDGNTVESVVMKYAHGLSVCISTQVGCAQGCTFCASTRGGLVRNLTASEMLDQVRLSGQEAGQRISNIVLMGIGEPLENMENVLRFLELVNHPDGLNVGMRHISVSTCGPAGGIERLMKEDLQITLSVSLHGADDETRSALMPVNRRSGGIERLMRDCDEYFRNTGRRISFEYLLARDKNDSNEQAEKLSGLLKGKNAHVNLIPLNSIDSSQLMPSSSKRVEAFKSILERNGINVTVRRRMGFDIDAACGQLRRKAITEEPVIQEKRQLT